MVVDEFCDVNPFVINCLNKFPLWNWRAAKRIHKFAAFLFSRADFYVESNVGVRWMEHILSCKLLFFWQAVKQVFDPL